MRSLLGGFTVLRVISWVSVRYGEIFHELKASEMSCGIPCAINERSDLSILSTAATTTRMHAQFILREMGIYLTVRPEEKYILAGMVSMETMKNYGKVKPGGDFAGCQFVAPKQREHRRCSTFHHIVSSRSSTILLYQAQSLHRKRRFSVAVCGFVQNMQ